MRKIPLTWILTLIVGSAVIICQAVDLKTLSCNADAIAKLQEGNVTCSFSMDFLGDFIISISYYTDTSDKLVMECKWDKIPDQCNFLRSPYKVVKVSRRAIKLKVSNISVPHLSAYRCSLWDGTYMFHSPFCAMLIHPDSYAVTSGGQTTTAAHLDQPSKRQDKHLDSEEGLSGGVVAGIVTCAVIIVVLTAVVVVLCYRELRRRTQATHSATIDSENAGEPMLPVNSASGQNSETREDLASLQLKKGQSGDKAKEEEEEHKKEEEKEEEEHKKEEEKEEEEEEKAKEEDEEHKKEEEKEEEHKKEEAKEEEKEHKKDEEKKEEKEDEAKEEDEEHKKEEEKELNM
ncbi:hypothetical protein ACOMHN_058719 [Nucella lapillus]